MEEMIFVQKFFSRRGSEITCGAESQGSLTSPNEAPTRERSETSNVSSLRVSVSVRPISQLLTLPHL